MKRKLFGYTVSLLIFAVTIAFVIIQIKAKFKQEILLGQKAPEVAGVAWINSAPLKIKDLRGKVVLVDFWEYTCINCLNTLPYVKEWHKHYAKDELVIIGVHTPEFEFGKDFNNVKAAVERLGIEYPVVLDNDYQTWNNFQNMYWPRKFLIDKNGQIRYDHIGEGNYADTEKEIQELLLEINPSLKFPPLMELVHDFDKPGAVCYPVTPELYIGFYRGRLGNKENYKAHEVVDFKDPGNHADGNVYINGKWYNDGENLRHAEKTSHFNDYIAIKYHALEVNLVIKPSNGGTFKVYVLQDEKPLAPEDRGEDVKVDENGKTYLIVEKPRMYQIVRNKKFGSHELKLSSDSDEFAAYAFTFTSCEIQ